MKYMHLQYNSYRKSKMRVYANAFIAQNILQQ